MEIELVSYDELAAALGAHKRTLRRWWEAGTFPEPIRMSPRKLAWRVQDVKAWLASRAAAAENMAEKVEA